MTTPGSICQHCGYRALIPGVDCPRCHRPYPTMNHPSIQAQNPTMQIPVAAPPMPAPPPYAYMPAQVPPVPGSNNGWQMIHAIQSTVLIVLLAAAVLLLFRHEAWLQSGGQPGGAPVDITASSVPDSPSSINVVVDHPTIVVAPHGPPVNSVPIHTGPTGRATRVGHTVTLASFITDRNYLPVPLDRLRWESRNPAVASVDGYGNVTGCAPGVAPITVTDTLTNASGTISILVERDGGAVFNHPPGQPADQYPTIRPAQQQSPPPNIGWRK